MIFGKIPERRGTYLLILRLSDSCELQIGKLGVFRFPAGYYGYVGSAFGAGGLAARVRHHLRSTTHPHWHIDYFRTVAVVEQVWLSESAIRQEHEWATALENIPETFVPAPGFGSSDCRCRSRLFHFSVLPHPGKFHRVLINRISCPPPLKCIHIGN